MKDTLELRRKEHREITEDIQEIRNKNSLTNSIIRVLGYNVSAEAEGKVLPPREAVRVAYRMKCLIKENKGSVFKSVVEELEIRAEKEKIDNVAATTIQKIVRGNQTRNLLIKTKLSKVSEQFAEIGKQKTTRAEEFEKEEKFNQEFLSFGKGLMNSKEVQQLDILTGSAVEQAAAHEEALRTKGEKALKLRQVNKNKKKKLTGGQVLDALKKIKEQIVSAQTSLSAQNQTARRSYKNRESKSRV